jgi:hypothetical protein
MAMRVMGWIWIVFGAVCTLASVYPLVTGRNYPGLLGGPTFRGDRERIQRRGPAGWRLMGATYAALGGFWVCGGTYYVTDSPLALPFAVPFTGAAIAGFVAILQREGRPPDLRRRLVVAGVVVGITALTTAVVVAGFLLWRHR